MARYLKKPDEKSGGADWMTTYSDMMTILFVFFVLLFSMSSINPVKWDILVRTFGNREQSVVSAGEPMLEEGEQPGDDIAAWLDQMLTEIVMEILANEGTPVDENMGEESQQGAAALDFEYIYDVISTYVEYRGYADRIDIEKDENYIMLRFKDRAFFASGSAIIESSGNEAIRFVGQAIILVIDQVDKIKIEGHTDSVPQNSWTFPDNWALGSARANAVRSIFESVGIPADRRLMEVLSLADTEPRASNDTPEGRSENRRVEIYITRANQSADTEPAHIIDGIAGESGLPG